MQTFSQNFSIINMLVFKVEIDINIIYVKNLGNDILVDMTQCQTTLYFGSKSIRHLTMAYNFLY